MYTARFSTDNVLPIQLNLSPIDDSRPLPARKFNKIIIPYGEYS